MRFELLTKSVSSLELVVPIPTHRIAGIVDAEAALNPINSMTHVPASPLNQLATFSTVRGPLVVGM